MEGSPEVTGKGILESETKITALPSFATCKAHDFSQDTRLH